MRKLKRGFARHVACLLAAVMAIASVPVSRAAADVSDFAGGDGYGDNPYLIATADQLNNVRNGMGLSYKLTADIDLSSYASADGGQGWTPIAGNFWGSFDGDGHTITGLKIDRPGSSKVGLFSQVGGEIKNVNVLGASVTGANTVGIIGGYAGSYGTLENVSVSGRVEGVTEVGGILGRSDSAHTRKASSHAEVHGSGSDAGGLIGMVYDGSGSAANVSDSYADGDVFGTGGEHYGGLVGYLFGGRIAGSYASGDVASAQGTAGGLIGYVNSGYVDNSYSLGTVTGAGYSAGGLIGYADGGAVSNSYASGKVAFSGNTGSLVGYAYNFHATNSVWDMTASESDRAFGYTSDPSGVSGYSAADMRTANSFAGWDWSGTWSIAEGKSYPYLTATPPLWLADVSVTPDQGQAGSLVPSFDSLATSYRVIVSNQADSVAVTAQAVDPNAQVSVSGGDNLVAGDNLVTITVSEAAGRPSRSYQLTVKKLSSTLSSDAKLTDLKLDGVSLADFDGDTLNYSATVGSTSSSVNVTAIAEDSGATYEVSGANNLSTGDNTVTVKVTASDGSTTRTYTITVTKSDFAGGSGTESSPYLISNADEFYRILFNSDKFFRLIDDIDLSAYSGGSDGWFPLYFTGSLDGDGHRITGLSIHRPDSDWVGLFYYISGGSITNLEVAGAVVEGHDNTGILAGGLEGATIRNVRVSGGVTGYGQTGGLAGMAINSTIESASSISTVEGNEYVGGLIGQNAQSSIAGSYSEGSVHGYSNVGGVAGYLYGSLSNSYSTADVIADASNAGGLAGSNDASITASYAGGKVQGASAAGGVVGSKNSGTLSKVYWDTTVSGLSKGVGSGSTSGTTGQTTANMMLSSKFSGWDFASTWNLNSGTSYPYLRALPPLWLSSMTGTANSGTAATLSPAFSSQTSAYTASVAADVTDVAFTAAAIDPNATVNVVGGANLITGDNVVTVNVSRPGGDPVRSYTVTVTRADASAARLSALAVSAGMLSPAFAAATTSYGISVPFTTSTLAVTPTSPDAGSTIKVNGTAVSSGQASGAIPLSVGANTVTVEVVSQDTTGSMTYTLTVTRMAGSTNANLSALTTTAGTLSPTFASGTTSYTASVANGTSSVTVKPTFADTTATATVRVNGGTASAVTSGTNSGVLALGVGSNTIEVTVTAQDGTTVKTYTITVTRAASTNANLSALTISSGTLSPTFAQSKISYTASVAYATSSMTVKPTLFDTTASVTVRVNGGTAETVASGTNSSALALNAGANTIEVTVTAQDGTTVKTYTITVTRTAASTNANLSALTVSSGTLSPTFAAGTITYTASVANATSSVTVKPTLSDTTASAAVRVNGGTVSAVASGTNSGALALDVGANTIQVIVTAQDGTTVKTYTITVTRAASADASLSELTISAGTLSPTFTANTTLYTASVANSVDSLTVKPTASGTGATIAVSVNDGTAVTATSGQDSSALALNTGSNTIKVVVTAQDGTTIKTYTITVTRAKSSANDLTAFSFEGLSPAVTGTIDGTTISLTVPFGTDVTALVASFVSSALSTVKVDATEQINGTTANNFASPVVYTVTAEDGTVKTYTVTVTAAPNPAKAITAFSIDGHAGVIDESAHTIAVTMPYGTDVTALAAAVTHSGASVMPGSGVAQDFSAPVTYTVTAEDGTTQSYVVTVTVARNSAKAITAFSIDSHAGAVDESAHTIAVTVPYGTNVTALATAVTHSGASVMPGSGVAQDFSAPVTYTVTAEDGTTQDYVVTVTVARNSAKAISAFSIDGHDGVIDESAHTIAVTMPYGTDVTALAAAVTHSGASVTPESGDEQDFSEPVTYTVTAEDGTAQSYVVTVTAARNPAKAITAFSIDGHEGVVDESARTIAVTVPYGTEVTALAAAVTHSGASVTPASGAEQDFSAPVTYTVTAEDGTTQSYVVTVTVARNPAKAITAFSIDGQAGVIDESAHTIAVTMPYGTDVTALAAAVTHSGASVTPESGDEQDFSEPVTYTVTAEDGTTQSYVVTVTVARNPSKAITAFSIDSHAGVIDESTHTIAVTLPYETDVTALAAAVTHSGASVTPESGVAQDFSAPVTYTVTAEDGTTQSYVVTVTVAGNQAKTITAFSIDGHAGVIDESAHTIAVTLPYGTEVTALAAAVTHSGASVTPESGDEQDFSSPVTYTVTAEDGTTQSYVVTVTVARNSAKAITAFSIDGHAGVINESAHTIAVTVPYGTEVGALAAAVTHSGASVTPGSGDEQDFGEPVTYTVTAEDGTTQSYVVTVTVARNPSKAITAFSIDGHAGVIDESAHTIAVTMPYGTDVTALAVAVTHSGASVTPASGAEQDFSDPVTYTVTAEDGTTQDYVVTVTVARNPSKAITAFSIDGHAGVIDESAHTIAVTMPYGTEVESLAAAVTHSGASVTPGSGDEQDFSAPVTYTVTAEDGTTQSYVVTVTVAGNHAKAITAFSIDGHAGVIDEGAHTIAVTVPYGTNVTALATAVTHSGASVMPGSGVAQDFSAPVTYTVTAEDGTTQSYVVTVTVAGNQAKTITTFSIDGHAGVIDEAGHTIVVTVPYGTNVKALVASFASSTVSTVKVGSVVQTSGATPNDFSAPVTYTVTAEDGSTRVYTVTVKVAAQPGGGLGGGGSAPVETDPDTIVIPSGASGSGSLANEIELHVPEGASNVELRIKIAKISDVAGLQKHDEIFLSPVFELLKNQPGTFKKPVTITLYFNSKLLKEDQHPSIFYYDEDQGQWVEIGGEVKEGANAITAEVDHFTKFAVLAVGDNPQGPEPSETDVPSFTDTRGHWAEAAIAKAVGLGIVNGYPDGTFRPNAQVTRAEFAVMLAHALKLQGDGASLTFVDKDKIADWAQEAVAQAVQAHILNGYADGSFRPNERITRTEMAAMVAKALKASSDAPTKTGYADDADIPQWAKAAVEWVRTAGVIQGRGDNRFVPNATATRAEAVTVLMNLLAVQ